MDLNEIKKNIDDLNSLLNENVTNDAKKEALSTLFTALGELFLTAPASSRKEYHNSYDGGLFDHCKNVHRNLIIFNEIYELGFSQEEMFVASFLHDIGKCCAVNLTEPFYKVQEDAYKKKNGMNYSYNNDPGYMTNRDRTMFILHIFEVPLTFQEYQAIMLNDGPFIEGNKSYVFQESDLAFYLHLADYIAARREERR